jgi:hypothetical protein
MAPVDAGNRADRDNRLDGICGDILGSGLAHID